MVEELINDVWMKIRTENVYKFWNDDYTTWPLEAGLVDNSPLKEFITNFIGDRPFKRMLIATSVNADDGEIIRLNEHCNRQD